MVNQDGSLACARRRSVDVGGLSLALENNGLGHGWGGWDEGEMGESRPRYAELLTEMRTHTLLAVNEHNTEPSTVELPTGTRARLIESLDSWHFEPHKLPEEELLSCTLILFEALFRVEGLQEQVGISLDQIPPFLRHLRQIYRSQNSYHNYQHALDVLQATHTFLRSAGAVPPVSILLEGDDRVWRPDKVAQDQKLISCLSLIDLFTVYIAAIGHDVGHPGFGNMFMKNAKTPLSVVYDDKSALEQMHCTLLLHVMRHHGMAHLLDRQEGGASFRKLLLETVLATDMSVHVNFMKRFEALVSGRDTGSPWSHKVLMCQALIKCADISNPSRPHRVSQYWANALMEEWTAQASLEKHFQLPATVNPSMDSVAEAKGQIFFINMFAKPLLELTARAIPEMNVYAQQCAANLKLWELRSTELVSTPDLPTPDAATVHPPDPPSSPLKPEDYSTAFPLTLPIAYLFPPEEHPPASAASSATTTVHSPTSSVTSSSEASFAPGPDDSNTQTAAAAVASTGGYADTPLASPANSIDIFVVSPQSESDWHPSNSGIQAGHGATPLGPGSAAATAALRAAYEASVRKKKSFNRKSWTPNVGVGVGVGIGYTVPRVAMLVSAAETVLASRPTRLDTSCAPPIGERM